MWLTDQRILAKLSRKTQFFRPNLDSGSRAAKIGFTLTPDPETLEEITGCRPAYKALVWYCLKDDNIAQLGANYRHSVKYAAASAAIRT